MKRKTPLFVVIAATALLRPTCGQISVDVATATPVRAESGTPGQFQSSTVPQGSQGLQFLSATAPAFAGEAFATWHAGAADELAFARWRLEAAVTSGPTTFARVQPSELVYTIQAPVATPITLALRAVVTGAPGGVLPAYAIDVGDDGIVEVHQGGPTSTTVSRTVGPAPLTVRVYAELQQDGVGQVELDLDIDIRPQNALVLQTVALPCNGTILDVWPTFLQRGVELRPFTSDPQVVVVGGSIQNQLLPALLPGPQCTLLPSPDIAVFVPLTGLHVPLPASLRPVQVFIQSVSLGAAGLGASNAHVLIAN